MAAAIPQTGLIGNWKLNETSGNIANEEVSDLDATVQGGAAFVPGRIKNALEVNNGPDGLGSKYAQMPTTSATLNNVQEGPYSISAWFYPYSVPSGSGSSAFWSIVTKYGQHMGLVYNSAQKFVARHYLAGPTLKIANSGTSTYPDSAWYHVVSVVDRGAGTLKLYVNGDSVGAETFTPNSAAFEYGTTPFRIGIAESDWAANGIVDQVRIYNVALTASQVDTLASEVAAPSAPTHPFMVGMTKGQQIGLLGDLPTPDGVMAAQSDNTITEILDAARNTGARVIIRVTGGNGNFQTNGDRTFVLSKWKQRFADNVGHMDMGPYLADGTLVGHYAIDEPFADFDNMNSGFLEDICEYQKDFAGWGDVPCLIREKNTKLHEKRPAGGTYQWVDAGWAAISDHHYDNEYGFDMGAYFRDNLAKGASAGLGMMYGFNLINGGREDLSGCTHLSGDHNCAMRASEIRQLADTLAAIGQDKACGVSGWEVDATSGSPERNYFFRTDIQDALEYLYTKVRGLRPSGCN